MDRMTALPETIKEPAKLWESTLKPMNASDEITGKIQTIFSPQNFFTPKEFFNTRLIFKAQKNFKPQNFSKL